MPENNLQIDAAERIERYSKFQIQWHLKFWRIKGILICTQSLNDLPFGVLQLSDQVRVQRFTLRRGDLSPRDGALVAARKSLGQFAVFLSTVILHMVSLDQLAVQFSLVISRIFFLSNYNKACSRHQIDALNSNDWVH